MKADALGLKCVGNSLVATGFVDPVFLVDVHGINAQLLAQLQQHGGGLIPGVGGADKQRDVQPLQAVAQDAQVAQPEIDFAGRVVVRQPLLRADQVHGHGRAALGTGAQGGVVMLAQIAA